MGLTHRVGAQIRVGVESATRSEVGAMIWLITELLRKLVVDKVCVVQFGCK